MLNDDDGRGWRRASKLLRSTSRRIPGVTAVGHRGRTGVMTSCPDRASRAGETGFSILEVIIALTILLTVLV